MATQLRLVQHALTWVSHTMRRGKSGVEASSFYLLTKNTAQAI